MNVLVVHRLRLFADALAGHLRGAPGIGHVVVAYGADQVIPKMSGQHYDVVLLTRAGMERCRQLRHGLHGAALPRVMTVVGTSGFNPALISEAERARMDAVVSLNQSAEDLARELGEVVAGTRGFRTSANSASPQTEPSALPDISYHDEMDVEIVRLVATGLRDKEISSRVHLSSQTVRNRVSRLLRDSRIENRTQLAAMYLRHEIRLQTS